MSFRVPISVATFVLAGASVPIAHAEEATSIVRGSTAEPTEDDVPDAPPPIPVIVPTLVWLAAQAVPSPGAAFGPRGTDLTLRWQVTPLLFSWGIHRGLFPWRSFVVTPNLRTSGSVELYVAPEVYFLRDTELAIRPGLRATFPLLDHGERLAASIGVSVQTVGGIPRASYEAGLHVLYGTFGLVVTATPAPDAPVRAIASFQVRYF
ncbi:MAG: hypothetical protein U0169_08295 [Polyangiaceae bacterium]